MPREWRIRTPAILGIVALCLSGIAQAQELPGPADPNRIEQRFEKPTPPQSQPELALPAPEQAPPPDQAGAIRFALKDIVLDGASVYAMAELRPLWAGLVGKEVSLLDIYTVRDALTARYRNDGYVLSQVIVPAQRIAGGVVRLQAIEGYIDDVRFEGAAFTDRLGVLEGYAAKIKASRPLAIRDLERYVLLADELPGVSARTVLQPAEGKPGAATLIFTLERRPVGGSLSLDNRGSRPIGPWQVMAAGQVNDQLGVFDRTSVQGIVTTQLRELRYIDVAHVEPVGGEGTTALLGVRRNWSRPGGEVRRFEIDSLGTTLRAGLSHPFVRERSQTLRADALFTVRNSRTTSFDQPLSEDRTRTLGLGASYDFADGWLGSNLFRLDVTRGLDILDATRTGSANLSRAGGRSDFTKLTASAQRNQPLTQNVSLVLAVDSQLSGQQLLSSEEFGIGGKFYGRAFDASELTGDSGAIGKLELQYLLPPPAPRVDYVQLYGFVDYGAVWNHEAGTRQGRRSLGSLGGGVRTGVFEWLDGQLEVAWPVTLRPEATASFGPRAFLSLSARY